MRTETLRNQFAAIVFATFASISPRAHGETVVVPNTNASTSGPGAGSTAPFRPNSRWQQVYSSQEFNAASGDVIRINEIRFRIDEMTSFSTFSTVAQGLSIFMSTTARTFGTASSVFAENPDTELFQALPLTDLPLSGSRTSATSFDVIVPLPNGYEYDRRTGNLLVDIRSVGGANVPFLDLQGFLPEATFGIGGALDSPTGTKGSIGFITHFQFEVVPEPHSVPLVAVGALGLFLFRKVWQ